MKFFAAVFMLLVSPAFVFAQGQSPDSHELPVDYHVNPAAFAALELKVQDHDQQIATLKGQMSELSVLVVNLGAQVETLKNEIKRIRPLRDEVPAPVEVTPEPDQIPVEVTAPIVPLAPAFSDPEVCADGSCGVSYERGSSGRTVFRRGIFRRR